MSENLGREQSEFYFIPTGIGSVPYLDVPGACRRLLESFPQAPFWPQFVKRSHLEAMVYQFSEGFDFLEPTADARGPSLAGEGLEEKLAAFYEHYLNGDLDHFAITRDYAPGLYEITEALGRDPERYGPYVKGQTVGPITFAASLSDREGQALLHNEEIFEALVKGISIKALWQVKKLEGTGKRPLLFVDEPYLSGYGSAFTPLGREEVLASLREIFAYLKERSSVLIGIHCCGNTDWSMIADSGPDIISFDAYEFMDPFLLFRESITAFVKAGGAIAWGIVPTHRFTREDTLEGLWEKLSKGIEHIKAWDIPEEVLFKGALLTPSCGMGTMSPASADLAVDLLVKLSERCRSRS